jgi:hypothetical protein
MKHSSCTLAELDAAGVEIQAHQSTDDGLVRAGKLPGLQHAPISKVLLHRSMSQI